MIAVLNILSLSTIATYVGIMVKKKGIPYSISATYYKLKNKYWFGLTMIASAAFLMPAILEKTPEIYQWTAWLSLVGMFMVGVSPNFKDKSEETLHIVGATMSLVFSQLWVFLMSPCWLLLWVLYLVYTIFMLKKNWTGNFKGSFIDTKPMFWVEITALAATFITLLII